ncbi:ATP-binding cassette domain-containing protein [Streptomyces sp. NPDC005389]|uniref:ABC transporter ATP-binding protein n=1 Tax=Streptomyces sp. NPDC005389 TaxID=3157040 RepID=UPI0033BAC283
MATHAGGLTKEHTPSPGEPQDAPRPGEPEKHTPSPGEPQEHAPRPGEPEAAPDGQPFSAGAPDAPPAVRAGRLVRRFGDRVVLKEIDLALAAGEFTALLGRSGSGKSTLLRAVAGLDHDVEGSGELLVPERVSLSFQDSRLLPWLRVLDNVTLGLRGPGARARGLTALAEVGLAGRERSWPHELSGGEQQRAALARALVRDPELLLADEPFGALDALTRIKMHDLLRELYELHRPAVLLVTHDVDEAVELADRVLVLDEGEISVDLAIDLPTPRDRRDPRFQQYRDALLAALGVHSAPLAPAPRPEDHPHAAHV